MVWLYWHRSSKLKAFLSFLFTSRNPVIAGLVGRPSGIAVIQISTVSRDSVQNRFCSQNSWLQSSCWPSYRWANIRKQVEACSQDDHACIYGILKTGEWTLGMELRPSMYKTWASSLMRRMALVYKDEKKTIKAGAIQSSVSVFGSGIEALLQGRKHGRLCWFMASLFLRHRKKAVKLKTNNGLTSAPGVFLSTSLKDL